MRSTQAAGGHVGGDQDADAAVFECGDGALALGLRDVAVDGRGREPARPKPFLRGPPVACLG